MFFSDALLAQTSANFGFKRRFFGKLVQNPVCVPKLKLLALTDAKICRESQFFLDAPLAQTPANFGLKCCFFNLVPNVSCVPNLKLLASTVAKISRGSNFLGCFPSPDPRQFWS